MADIGKPNDPRDSIESVMPDDQQPSADALDTQIDRRTESERDQIIVALEASYRAGPTADALARIGNEAEASVRAMDTLRDTVASPVTPSSSPARSSLARWSLAGPSMNDPFRITRILVLLFAVGMFTQGLTDLFNGSWLADNLGETYEPHVWREAGIAYVTIGIGIGFAGLRRQTLPIAVIQALPLGVALGIIGLTEIGQFTLGVVVHGSQGLLAIAIGLAYRRALAALRAGSVRDVVAESP